MPIQPYSLALGLPSPLDPSEPPSIGRVMSLPSPPPSDGNRRHPSSTPTHALVERQHSQAQPATTTYPQLQNPASPVSKLAYRWNEFQSHYRANLQMFEQGMGTLTDAESRRLSTLTEAVKCWDIGFVIYHQILCLYADDPSKVVRVLEPTSQGRQGIMRLDGMMNTNDSVRPRFLRFWSHFPADIAHLHSRDPKYTMFVPRVMDSLNVFNKGFEHLRQKCHDRRYPPSVGEIMTDLLISSAVLQRVVFHSLVQVAFSHLAFIDMHSVMQTFKDQDQENWGRCMAQKREHEYSDRDIADFWRNYIAAQSLRQRQVQKHLAQASIAGRTSVNQTAPLAQTPALSNALHGPSIRTASAVSNTANLNVPAPHTQTVAGPPPPAALIGGRRSQVPPTSTPHGIFRQPPQPILRSQDQSQTPPGAALNISIPTAASNIAPKKRFFAKEGQGGVQVAPPNPNEYALHQAHLRSPRLELVDTATGEELFRHVSSLALPPSKLRAESPIQSYTFNLTDEEFKCLPEDCNGKALGDGFRRLRPDSATYRLRCVQGAPTTDSLSQWILQETTWPNEVQFEFNEQRLHPRLKLHFGRSLPIDLTAMVRSGTNTIEVFTLPRYDDKPRDQYSIAVERVTLMTPAQIHTLACANKIPPIETIRAIWQAINPTPPAPDSQSDEIKCLATTIPIHLIDPILAVRIWRTPTRTRACKHREAFDLATFLKTRLDPHAPTQPSSADVWQCPICDADARPDQLVIDGFLSEVRQELEKKGLLETAKVVDVDEKGAWTVREERRASARPTSGTDGTGDGPTDTRKVAEVVDLCD